MSFWTKLKLLLGGFLTGLLLMFGIRWRRKQETPSPPGKETLEDITTSFEEEVEGVKKDIETKTTQEKIDELQEINPSDAPWGRDVNIHIPRSFRATEPDS